jgi:hypothetical protein
VRQADCGTKKVVTPPGAPSTHGWAHRRSHSATRLRCRWPPARPTACEEESEVHPAVTSRRRRSSPPVGASTSPCIDARLAGGRRRFLTVARVGPRRSASKASLALSSPVLRRLHHPERDGVPPSRNSSPSALTSIRQDDVRPREHPEALGPDLPKLGVPTSHGRTPAHVLHEVVWS